MDGASYKVHAAVFLCCLDRLGGAWVEQGYIETQRNRCLYDKGGTLRGEEVGKVLAFCKSILMIARFKYISTD